VRLLGLPGRKASTLTQMTDLVERLAGGQAAVRSYGFWGGADVPDPDVGPEALAVADSGAELLVCKSIGTLIAMLARERHGFIAKSYVFIGSPLRRFEAEGLIDILRRQAHAAPTLFIQQTADFNGAYADLAAAVGAAPFATMAEVPGDDHLYSDTMRLAQIIEAWRASAPT